MAGIEYYCCLQAAIAHQRHLVPWTVLSYTSTGVFTACSSFLCPQLYKDKVPAGSGCLRQKVGVMPLY